MFVSQYPCPEIPFEWANVQWRIAINKRSSNYHFSHLLFYYWSFYHSSIYLMSHLSFVSSINCRFYLLSFYVLSYTVKINCIIIEGTQIISNKRKNTCFYKLAVFSYSEQMYCENIWLFIFRIINFFLSWDFSTRVWGVSLQADV